MISSEPACMLVRIQICWDELKHTRVSSNAFVVLLIVEQFMLMDKPVSWFEIVPGFRLTFRNAHVSKLQIEIVCS